MPAPAAAALDALRHALDTVVERERPRDDPSLPTGLTELDAMLGGGLPRGRLSELQAPRGQGRTTLMRALVAHTLATGRWVAIVDAQRTLAPADWARLASPPSSGPGAIGTTPPPSRGPVAPESETSRLAVIRPADPSKAPWCADVLLRSGAYALVVLDGVPALPRSTVLRLTRLAHDRQVVFLLAGDAEDAIPTVGASVRLGIRIESTELDQVNRKWLNDGATVRAIRLVRKGSPAAIGGLETAPPAPPTSHLVVTVAKGGPPATTRLPYVITAPRRLGCHADVPDRRGVARSTPAPPKAAGGSLTTAGIGPVAKSIGRVDRSPHARRAGESRYGRR